MIFFKKIKASALQFAILVSVMVALLLGSFLTLTHTHRFFNSQSDFLLSSIEGANEEIHASLKADYRFQELDIEGGENYSNSAKGFWGGFTKITSTTRFKSKVFTKIALTGSIPDIQPTSIYVSDDDLPIVVVGDTKIESDAYIPKKGIKAGTMGGNYYSGKELVSGKIRTSSSQLPPLDPDWKLYIQKLLSAIPSNEQFKKLESSNTSSFFENTSYIYSQTSIILTQSIIGNFIVKSDQEIIVTPNCKLIDVTLVAPKITVNSGFKGSVHLIATDQIMIEEKVSLEYPSSLVVSGKTDIENTPIPKGKEPIVISDYSDVQGTCVYLENNSTNTASRRNTNTQMYIAPEATLQGMVYCEGNLELAGTVVGSVYTKKFLANQFGSRFINHIYNGKVLGRNLNKDFAALPFANTEKGIARWLY